MDSAGVFLSEKDAATIRFLRIERLLESFGSSKKSVKLLPLFAAALLG
jgi:hypothetical protein